MTGRDINPVLSVDEIIAGLGRYRRGGVVTLCECTPPDKNFLVTRRGKREVLVSILGLSHLKRVLRKLGYKVVTTPEVKRAIRRWNRAFKKRMMKLAEKSRIVKERIEGLQRWPPWPPRDIIYGRAVQ